MKKSKKVEYYGGELPIDDEDEIEENQMLSKDEEVEESNLVYDEEAEDISGQPKKVADPNGDALAKFRGRVAIESMTKSLMFGAMAMLLAITVVSLLFFVFKARISAFVAVISVLIPGAAACIGSFIFFYMKVFRTRDTDVAARVDGLGLEERAVTMVEYAEDEDSYIVKKQREDASDKLVKIEPKDVKFRVPKLAIALLVAICAFTIPAISMSLPKVIASPEELQANEIVKIMIEEMRSDIKAAVIPETLKSELNAVVDKCETEIKELYTINFKMNRIEQTRDEIDAVISNYLKGLDKEENRIVDDMLQEIRKTINDAEISQILKDSLHTRVDTTENVIFNLGTTQEKIDAAQKLKDDILSIIKAEQDKAADKLAQESEKLDNQAQKDALKDLAEAIKNNDAAAADKALEDLKEAVKQTPDAEVKEDVQKIADAVKEAAATLPSDSKLAEAMKELSTNLSEAAKANEPAEAKQKAEAALENAKSNLPKAAAEPAAPKQGTEQAVQEAVKKLTDLEAKMKEAESAEQQMKEAADEALKELGKIQNSNPGSGSLSGTGSGTGSGSGSGSGSGTGGSMPGSNSGTGSIPGSNSGTGSVKGTNSKSGGSNPGSNSGSGGNDNPNEAVVSFSSAPITLVDNVTPAKDKLIANMDVFQWAQLEGIALTEDNLGYWTSYYESIKNALITD